MSSKIIVGNIFQDVYVAPTVLRYDSIGTANAVKILPKVDTVNGYIKLYTELDSHLEIGDIAYITYSSNTYVSDDYLSGVYSNFTLDNEIISILDNNYPYSEFRFGYKILDVNQSENSVVINKMIGSIVPGTKLYGHYISKISCKYINIYSGTIDSTIIKDGVLNSSDTINWIQGVVLGGDITATTIKDKYQPNYISLLCTYNDITSGITKNINLNNHGHGYSYYYDLSNSIKMCNIENGNFYNCSLSSNLSSTKTIKNGYFKDCSFNYYTVENGAFIDTVDFFNINWLNGIWSDNKNQTPFTHSWFNGTFESGNYVGTTWYDGIFNNGTFSGLTWLNGTFNNGVFGHISHSGVNSTTWYDGIINNGLIQYTNWQKGVFNNGKIIRSKWYGGTFNNGIFSASTWFNGNFNNGDFVNSYWSDGNFNNGTHNSNWSPNSFIMGGNFNGGVLNNSEIFNTIINKATLNKAKFRRGTINDSVTMDSYLLSSLTFVSEVIVKPHLIGVNSNNIPPNTYVKFEFKTLPHDFKYLSNYRVNTSLSGFGFMLDILDGEHISQSSGFYTENNSQINQLISDSYVVTKTPYQFYMSNAKGFVYSMVKRTEPKAIDIKAGDYRNTIIMDSKIYGGKYSTVCIKGNVDFYGGDFYGNEFNSHGGFDTEYGSYDGGLSGFTSNVWYGGNFWSGTFGWHQPLSTYVSEFNSDLSSDLKISKVDSYQNNPAILIYDLEVTDNAYDINSYYWILANQSTNKTILPKLPLKWTYKNGAEILNPYYIRFPGTIAYGSNWDIAANGAEIIYCIAQDHQMLYEVIPNTKPSYIYTTKIPFKDAWIHDNSLHIQVKFLLHVRNESDTIHGNAIPHNGIKLYLQKGIENASMNMMLWPTSWSLKYKSSPWSNTWTKTRVPVDIDVNPSGLTFFNYGFDNSRYGLDINTNSYSSTTDPRGTTRYYELYAKIDATNAEHYFNLLISASQDDYTITSLDGLIMDTCKADIIDLECNIGKFPTGSQDDCEFSIIPYNKQEGVNNLINMYGVKNSHENDSIIDYSYNCIQLPGYSYNYPYGYGYNYSYKSSSVQFLPKIDIVQQLGLSDIDIISGDISTNINDPHTNVFPWLHHNEHILPTGPYNGVQPGGNCSQQGGRYLSGNVVNASIRGRYVGSKIGLIDSIANTSDLSVYPRMDIYIPQLVPYINHITTKWARSAIWSSQTNGTNTPWTAVINDYMNNLNLPDYDFVNIFDNNYWKIENGKLKIAIKFSMMEKYYQMCNDGVILNDSTKGQIITHNASPKVNWWDYWKELAKNGLWVNRLKTWSTPYNVTSSNFVVATGIKYDLWTDWLILPGLYKLPCSTTFNGDDIQSGDYPNWTTFFKMKFTHSFGNQTIQSYKDVFSGGTFHNGTFNGIWKNTNVKSFWRGGVWNMAWNDDIIGNTFNHNLPPEFAHDTTFVGSVRTLYNKNDEHMIETGRFLVEPPWVKKDKYKGNIITIPYKKERKTDKNQEGSR